MRVELQVKGMRKREKQALALHTRLAHRNGNTAQNVLRDGHSVRDRILSYCSIAKEYSFLRLFQRFSGSNTFKSWELPQTNSSVQVNTPNPKLAFSSVRFGWDHGSELNFPATAIVDY
jgi:hypothetical protein